MRFGAGIALEELVLRHALSMPLEGLVCEPGASGVMMLPIPRRACCGVDGQDAAKAVPGITGLEITIPPGRRVVPLPEGDRYLGFLFRAAARRPRRSRDRCAALAVLAVVIDADPTS